MAPATVKYYAEYPGSSGKYWAIPLEGDAVGWAYRKDWFEDPKEMAASRPSTATTSPCRRTSRQLRDIAEFFYRPDREALRRRASTPTTPTTRWRWASRTRIFSYGGELGDYATYKVDGIINSDKSDRGARGLQGALQVHASGLGQDLLRRGQPGDHRGPGGDEHELLRLLPGAGQRGDQPARQGHRLLRQSRRARAATQFAALGGQGISIVSYSQEAGRGDEVPRVVHQGRDPEEVGRARRLHLQRRRC